VRRPEEREVISNPSRIRKRVVAGNDGERGCSGNNSNRLLQQHRNNHWPQLLLLLACLILDRVLVLHLLLDDLAVSAASFPSPSSPLPLLRPPAFLRCLCLILYPLLVRKADVDVSTPASRPRPDRENKGTNNHPTMEGCQKTRGRFHRRRGGKTYHVATWRGGRN
jgi:hypothetical protein